MRWICRLARRIMGKIEGLGYRSFDRSRVHPVARGICVAADVKSPTQVGIAPKVTGRRCRNPQHGKRKRHPVRPGHQRYEESQALENTVRVIRKAQGKPNPEDFPYGSPEWYRADEAYMLDLLRAMGEDLDDLEE
jgi:hypothetical protein